MATASEFKPPAPLCFTGNDNLDEDFKYWEQKFRYFIVASGKHEIDKMFQVGMLFRCIGDDGIDIFNSFEWAYADEKYDLNKVLDSY